MPARVLMVGQAFKGTLDGPEVVRAMTAGATRAGCAVRGLVGSDGGDGLLEALALSHRTRTRVPGPRGESLEATIGWLDDRTAIVESRLACGLGLLPRDRWDPRVTTTRGVGEMIVAAAAAGATAVYVGLGGSATMDGGLGMARAWGWRGRGASGRILGEGGGALRALAALEEGSKPTARLVGLVDVRNYLLGEDGAAVFAPQKGAGPAAVAHLMEGLARLVEVARPWGGPVHAEREGAGAAGGLGFGLLCFGGAELIAGAPWVLDRLGFDDELARAGLVVVAEATFDATSLAGKLAGEVLRRAQARGVPTLLLAPRATAVPPGTLVESASGVWSAADLARYAERGIRRALRLPVG